MPPKKTPTSSLPGNRVVNPVPPQLTVIIISAITLYVNRVRYRSLATIQRILSRGTPLEIPSTHSSLVAKLPQEVLETVIDHLACDKPSLRACCMTCYSWYIAAVPLLHQILFVSASPFSTRKSRWPNPILGMRRLGLLPLVKDLRIIGGDIFDLISPKLFPRSVMSSFATLKHVRKLDIWHLNIPSFMPRIQQYFGHFLPTVRLLALTSPKGSRRQILFFIGLFQRLEHLSLYNITLRPGDVEPADDPTLIPPSSPPLGGRLIVQNVKRHDLIKDMVRLFGGIRFRRMHIWDAAETRLLLNACAKTLWRLQLHPNDPRGEQLHSNHAGFPANRFTANSSLHSFNLSQNKSLWDIEVLARFIDDGLRAGSMDTASELVKYALSSINPSTSCRVALIYEEPCFRGIKTGGRSVWPHLRELSHDERTEEAATHHQRFEFLRELRKVRDFRVTLCTRVWGPVGEYAVQGLKEAVAAERARKGFDEFRSGLSMTHNPRTTPW